MGSGEVPFRRVLKDRERGKAKRSGPRGVIYFIRCSDWIRIGFSGDLSARLNAYLVHCAPHEVLWTISDMTMGHEADWHDRFVHLRVNAERPSWYHAAPELLAAIEAAKNAGP